MIKLGPLTIFYKQFINAIVVFDINYDGDDGVVGLLEITKLRGGKSITLKQFMLEARGGELLLLNTKERLKDKLPIRILLDIGEKVIFTMKYINGETLSKTVAPSFAYKFNVDGVPVIINVSEDGVSVSETEDAGKEGFVKFENDVLFLLPDDELEFKEGASDDNFVEIKRGDLVPVHFGVNAINDKLLRFLGITTVDDGPDVLNVVAENGEKEEVWLVPNMIIKDATSETTINLEVFSLEKEVERESLNVRNGIVKINDDELVVMSFDGKTVEKVSISDIIKMKISRPNVAVLSLSVKKGNESVAIIPSWLHPYVKLIDRTSEKIVTINDVTSELLRSYYAIFRNEHGVATEVNSMKSLIEKMKDRKVIFGHLNILVVDPNSKRNKKLMGVPVALGNVAKQRVNVEWGTVYQQSIYVRTFKEEVEEIVNAGTSYIIVANELMGNEKVSVDAAMFERLIIPINLVLDENGNVADVIINDIDEDSRFDKKGDVISVELEVDKEKGIGVIFIDVMTAFKNGDSGYVIVYPPDVVIKAIEKKVDEIDLPSVARRRIKKALRSYLFDDKTGFVRIFTGIPLTTYKVFVFSDGTIKRVTRVKGINVDSEPRIVIEDERGNKIYVPVKEVKSISKVKVDSWQTLTMISNPYVDVLRSPLSVVSKSFEIREVIRIYDVVPIEVEDGRREVVNVANVLRAKYDEKTGEIYIDLGIDADKLVIELPPVVEVILNNPRKGKFRLSDVINRNDVTVNASDVEYALPYINVGITLGDKFISDKVPINIINTVVANITKVDNDIKFNINVMLNAPPKCLVKDDVPTVVTVEGEEKVVVPNVSVSLTSSLPTFFVKIPLHVYSVNATSYVAALARVHIGDVAVRKVNVSVVHVEEGIKLSGYCDVVINSTNVVQVPLKFVNVDVTHDGIESPEVHENFIILKDPGKYRVNAVVDMAGVKINCDFWYYYVGYKITFKSKRLRVVAASEGGEAEVRVRGWKEDGAVRNALISINVLKPDVEKYVKDESVVMTVDGVSVAEVKITIKDEGGKVISSFDQLLKSL